MEGGWQWLESRVQLTAFLFFQHLGTWRRWVFTSDVRLSQEWIWTLGLCDVTLSTLNRETAGSSEPLVTLMWHHIPEDCSLYKRSQSRTLRYCDSVQAETSCGHVCGQNIYFVWRCHTSKHDFCLSSTYC